MPGEMNSNFGASSYRKWVVEMQMQQTKNGHSNKYFIEIAASVRIRIFLYLACCSVHENTKKELDQYIFLTLVPNKCEQELHLGSHLFAH